MLKGLTKRGVDVMKIFNSGLMNGMVRRNENINKFQNSLPCHQQDDSEKGMIKPMKHRLGLNRSPPALSSSGCRKNFVLTSVTLRRK